MKKIFKFGCGGLIALFALLILIGSLLGDDSENTKTKEKITSSTETDASNNSAEVRIGEELTIGKVTFIVNSIDEASQISAANGYMKYTPDADGAVFLNVNLTVRNEGEEMIQTDSSFFKLKTASGAEYSPSTIIAADEKYFTFEGINPGLALTGNVVFEVPTGLTNLDLQVQTGYWGTENGNIKLN